MLLGYARVSTEAQDTKLQIDALKKAGCTRIFEEKASGGKVNRPELSRILDIARKGDVLVIWKLDRLARSIRQLIETAQLLEERGVQLRSLTESIDTTTAGGKLTFHIFAALAEFERGIIRERTFAGLAAARSDGRYGGRPPKLTDEHIERARAMLAHGKSIPDLMVAFSVSRATLYNHGLRKHPPAAPRPRTRTTTSVRRKRARRSS